MNFDITVEVRKASWLSDPRKRWNHGLKFAGQAWQTEARKYPPSPPNEGLRGTGTRVMNLGKKAQWEITSEGREMTLSAPLYYRWLLFGTGIYGERGAPITPISSPFLVWRVTDMTHPLAGQLVFVRSVRGTIWEGKLEEVTLAVKEAFLEGVRVYDGG